jgi:DNA-binding SARP family transcriptional activator
VAAPASVRIELLGGFGLFIDGRLHARQPGIRQQQLIAFLVLHARGVPIPRQRVAGSLWPESTDVQALTNLRRELHQLREGWPQVHALIDGGTRTVAWRTTAAPLVDVEAFEAASDAGLGAGDRRALTEAARLYRGNLLPACEDDWIDGDRERLRQRATKVLAQLVTLLEKDRAFDEAIEHAQTLLRLDPLEEGAWRTLMRAQARRGDRAGALETYQRCAATLKKELGVGPSAATRLVYREIVDTDAGAPVAAPIGPQPPPRASGYPLVGRRSEWGALLDAWRTARTRHARLAAIRGEAGIGKTRLAEELVAWCGLNGVNAIGTRCYAGEGRLAYAPLAAWLKSDTLKPILPKLQAPWLTDLARLHPALLAARPDVPAPAGQLESWERLRFFEAVTQALRAAAPLVLLLDDMQWADGDTIDWLHHFVRSTSELPCLVVATIRVEEEQDNPPLERMLAQLAREDLLTTIALGPLDRTATAQLASQVLEQPLDEDTLARTFRETEGHPLFIVERGRMELAREPGAGPVEPLPRVQSVVAARLALLTERARTVAEIAATIGRDFRLETLAHAGDLDEETLVDALDELWRRHIVRTPDEDRWDFSHDRIREIAYSQIGPARRQLLHRRVAQAIERQSADRLDEVSAAIAAHLERGGQPSSALPFLERAAAAALRVSAHAEAIRLLNHALAIVARLPAGPERDVRELALREHLSVALNSDLGYAATEVEQNLDRVFALAPAGARGDVPVRWLWAAFTLRFMLGDLRATREISELAYARSAADPSCRCEAHHAMGGTLLSLGELHASRDHFEAALAAYDEARPQRSALGSDLGVFAHAWYSHTLWMLGEEEAALAHAARAIALADRLQHPYNRTLALAYAALLHQLRLDAPRVLACAEAAMKLCDQHGFGYYGEWSQALLGWARGLDRPADGIAVIETALERLDRNRARARRPYYLSLLADTHLRNGDRSRASSIVDEAVAMAADSGDSWWLPALYLQRSALEHSPAREATLARALDLARRQNSRSLEARILASIASSV